jgi:membrane protease YdiL (CAAX protease family)
LGLPREAMMARNLRRAALSVPAMKPSAVDDLTARASGIAGYFALACGITWVLALPAALAWIDHRPPSPLAVGCAGLSAFGPLLAALAIAGPRRQVGAVFGRWRTSGRWILLALAAAPLVHVIATALVAVIGGHPTAWFHPPRTPEAAAALIVFPLGEEFGWRGFAHPRLVARFGAVKGCVLLGVGWGLWHLVYSVTPETAGFDLLGFGMLLLELPLYALMAGALFERANRSMAVALAFHAGMHLDRIEPAARADLRLRLLHLLVLTTAAMVAVWQLSRRPMASLERQLRKSAQPN